MEPQPERKVFRMEIPRDQIQGFLDDLHKMQIDYVELAVEQKAKQGFPEANEAIKRIMDL